MTLNRELLERTLKWCEAFPEEWNQSVWRSVRNCGTVMCFAGRVCEITGAEWYGDTEWVVAGPEDKSSLVHRVCDINRLDFGADTTLVIHPSDRAERLLGLTSSQAFTLFFSSLETDVRPLVEQFLAEDVNGQPGS